MKFKVGDVVRCVRGYEGSTSRVVEGSIYTVRCVYSETIGLREQDCAWSESRFVLHTGAGTSADPAPSTMKQAEKAAAELVELAQASAAELVTATAARIAAEEVAAAAAAAIQAKRDRFKYEKALAEVTGQLLYAAEALTLDNVTPSARTEYAKFRKELQPLAESHGTKIVLIGDKTKATLVLL